MRSLSCLIISLLFLTASTALSETKRLEKHVLMDKIKGGWAGQTIGCTFGGPTEFKFLSTFIPDDQPIPWYDGYLKDTYEKRPGLYDDVYMDLTFVDILEREGLDAPAETFALAFAHANYPLWHANQMARYNILNGIMPPESGHWLNNPHADDIDFQIEADFAGLMAPGMVNTAAEICDRVGHIMNYGDGWYGGVYVAALYSLAFISDDISWIVRQALKTIPGQSQFAQVIQDVIEVHQENPDDWQYAWFKIQQKWNRDVGCPDGVFHPFNIDAKINSAWIVIGLLYGNGDFGKTLSISTRLGDDSDCNPASAGGILGTMIGYSQLPGYWKMGLTEVESLDFRHMTLSLADAYRLSYKHALQVIEQQQGRLNAESVEINIQDPKPVRYEQAFTGHYPVERRQLGIAFDDSAIIEISGIGFAINGRVQGETGSLITDVDVYIDGKNVETVRLPANWLRRKETLFHRYQLPPGRHELKFIISNPSPSIEIQLHQLIIYDTQPPNTEHGS